MAQFYEEKNEKFKSMVRGGRRRCRAVYNSRKDFLSVSMSVWQHLGIMRVQMVLRPGLPGPYGVYAGGAYDRISGFRYFFPVKSVIMQLLFILRLIMAERKRYWQK